MGSLFRSEPMQLVQLFVQIEASHDTVDQLGRLGLIQFRDLCPEVSAFQRNFVNEVKRCDAMEVKVRFFEEQVQKEIRELEESGKDVSRLLESEDHDVIERKLNMDEMESTFEELQSELQQMNNNQEILERNYTELVELKHVLTKDADFFFETGVSEIDQPDEESVQKRLLAKPAASGGKAVGGASVQKGALGFVTGVIAREVFAPFERVLWRATRGNLFMKYSEVDEKIKDPHTGELLNKNVFIIFYQGELAHTKIKKICESFRANLYPCPESAKGRQDLLSQVETKLKDHETILSRTTRQRRQVLVSIAKNIKPWKVKVIKEKSIYHTMNMFNYDVGRKCLIAEGWCPRTSTEAIVTAMRAATESSGALVPSILSVIPSKDDPPTFFKTNKFTGSFQGLVDAYGIARYQEVNPGVFTIITFPFLFAVMFGDVGHGFIMALVAGLFILNEKKLAGKPLNEMVQTVYDGRYMLFMMGLFSIYTGLIYNEAFAVGLDLFGSQWEFDIHGRENTTKVVVATIRAGYENRPYPFGVDPAWKGATNTLMYYNSLKMKMSILLGVVQMTTGICMSLMNGLYFKHKLDIYCEFIPQMLFMMSIFGYLCFLIIFKWFQPADAAQHPMILQVMIQMFLSPVSIAPENHFFDGQLAIQLILILVAVVSVPWMLVSKPYILKKRHEAKVKGLLHHALGESHDDEDDDGHHGDAEFDFGEIFVKQTIHTIEFVLGGISNTASYLRLWALSLAHAELSEVFLGRVLVGIGLAGGPFELFISFAVWAGATIGILMIMESLSAFLHALRLHWVEFMNKFFHGDGYKFIPFSYAIVLQGDVE
eukprot:TRINITY_DN2836_c0_g1_i2.p1 TRINITY_DN2836_c0_g1~~TRINITY_DN2836_c0_g1_i2.p1  ORF type:complete len:827 (-),score=364.90 TRINITY_DN2836_c0_g1_i2:293-2773(-)